MLIGGLMAVAVLAGLLAWPARSSCKPRHRITDATDRCWPKVRQ
jgi:hypothetical protein